MRMSGFSPLPPAPPPYRNHIARPKLPDERPNPLPQLEPIRRSSHHIALTLVEASAYPRAGSHIPPIRKVRSIHAKQRMPIREAQTSVDQPVILYQERLRRLATVGLAGHRDTFFRPLRTMKPHTEIQLVVPGGTYRYSVNSTKIVTRIDPTSLP